MESIIEFIKRRFPSNCNWLDGNCYYFAKILNERFIDGEIYYDVIYGHFIFKYQDKYFDWSGEVHPTVSNLVKWDDFDEYDSSQRKIVVRDCIM